MDVEAMTLEQIQAELREETPPRSQDDAARRQQLWRRLDHLVAQREAGRIERDDPDHYVVELTCSTNPVDGVPVGDGYRARLVEDDETVPEPSRRN
jgi:hypothetical protein